MEKELGGDEVIVEILGAEKRLNSSDPNGEIEIEKQEVSTTPSVSESPKNPKVSPPVTPKEYDEDDDSFTKTLEADQTRKRHKKIKLLFVIEFSLFVCITLVLILSKTVNKFRKKDIWELELWKWCVFALAILCGRKISKWLMNVVVFLIEKNLFLTKKVLYFVYGVQKNVTAFIWLGLILLAWVLLINRGVHRSRDTAKILNYITRGIVSTDTPQPLKVYSRRAHKAEKGQTGDPAQSNDPGPDMGKKDAQNIP